ncbi:MAG TPA: DUF4062 domain-containing protein [Anaerolineae bacterium]|nr:DUF4062 domain-containing protein [Anaerolineae bacterium]
MSNPNYQPVIRTPDQRLRVFVSSTLQELAEERSAAREAIAKLRLAPVMFELGARPHPPRELYRAYLDQSHIFIGIYWQRYGWIAPGETLSGLEDEYRLSDDRPKLIYIKAPAPEREPRLKELLDQVRSDDRASYKPFTTAAELRELIENDLALLLTERFEAAQPVEIDAAPATPRRRHNLPAPPTRMIGREAELATARELLLRNDVNLLTMTGPGGAGKTRLAIEAASGLCDHFAEGVFFVALAPTREPNLVPAVIAQTLDVRETIGGQPVLEALKEYLRNKRMLLLLDNFEQVVSAAPLIGELLEACPHLKVLVTSRVTLRLRGEKDLPIPPLALPDRTQPLAMASLSQYAAVQLFIQRALEVNADFTVTNATAPAIAEICQRLDGLPLAIELAAARTKVLSPQALLARLERRLEMLRGGPRDLPVRQQTLRDAIGWSYDLLDEPAQKLFRRLSIFVNGWTLEAAEEVCNAAGDLDVDVLDEMEALLDNSLLYSSESQGELRFAMLGTIHEFAYERLVESGEERALRWCHAGYFLELAEAAEPHLLGAARQLWIERLEIEHDNLRAVLAWSRTPPGDLETGLRIAGAIRWFWFFRGYLSEGRNWLESMLAGWVDTEALIGLEPYRAKALGASGGLAWTQGDMEIARVRLEESIALYREIGDQARLAQMLMFRGLWQLSAGNLTAARDQLEESLRMLHTVGEKWLEAFGLDLLGDAIAMSGDLAEARSRYEQSLTIFKALNDTWGIGLALNSLAGIAWFQDDHGRACELYSQSVALAREVGDRWTVVRPLLGLLDASWHQGDFSQAKALAVETLTLCRDLGALSGLLLSLGGAAGLFTARNRPDVAARLLGASDALGDRIGFVTFALDRLRTERNLAEARARLEEAAFKAAWVEGQALTPDQAIDYALREVERV